MIGYEPNRCHVCFMSNEIGDLTTELRELSIWRTSAIVELQLIDQKYRVVKKKLNKNISSSRKRTCCSSTLVIVSKDKFGAFLITDEKFCTVTSSKYKERYAKVKDIQVDTVTIQFLISNSITWRKSRNLMKQ